MTRRTTTLWIPLVDEPIGSIVAQLQAEHPEIDAARRARRTGSSRSGRSPTSASGSLLGQLLVENDVPDYDGTETWIEALLRDPAHQRGASCASCARSPRRSPPTRATRTRSRSGPDDDARDRFREFARKQLG